MNCKMLLLYVPIILAYNFCLSQNNDNRKQVVEKLYTYFDSGKIEKLNEIVDEKLIDHDGRIKENGFAELKELIISINQGFSNVKHEIEQIQLIGENKILVRWEMKAIHNGAFFGIPASNKSVVLNGHDIFAFKNGKISEQWHIEELLSLMNQITIKN